MSLLRNPNVYTTENTLLDENFAAWKFSQFRQIEEFRGSSKKYEFRGILISWSKQKMKKVNDLHVWKLCIFTYGENKLRRF